MRMTRRSCRGLCAAMVVLILALTARAAEVVYTQDFDREHEPMGWSPAWTTLSPKGGVRFLGPYGGESTVVLTLDDLPAHQRVRLRFDLIIVGSMDGEGGPGQRIQHADRFRMTVDGERRLMDTSFTNIRLTEDGGWGMTFEQQFPGLARGERHAAHTGAARSNELGFTFNQRLPADSVYQLDLIFPHDQPTLTLTIDSTGMAERSDEGWGLNNVRIETLRAPEVPAMSEAERAAAWRTLRSEDPTAAFTAGWKLVAQGDRVVEDLAARLTGADGAGAAERQIARLIEALDAAEYEARVEATAQLREMLPAAAGALQRASAAAASPEVRWRARLVLEQGFDADLADRKQLQRARALRVLELIGTPAAQAALERATVSLPDR